MTRMGRWGTHAAKLVSESKGNYVIDDLAVNDNSKHLGVHR